MASSPDKIGATAVRGRVLTFLGDPAEVGDEACHRYIEDGMVVMEAGRILAVDDAATVLKTTSKDLVIEHYADCFILPGFIDTHIHFPQTQVIASYGTQLLEWLEKYTFVEEARFADSDHARAIADFFHAELLRNGTTTALAYGTVHGAALDAFFASAQDHGMRMIAGKSMMNRNAPDNLRDDVDQAVAECERLIATWHGRGRLAYAVTPRFAITSTAAQLDACGALLAAHPDVYMQTHLSENTDEVAEIKRLFPNARDYTDVYERAGLLGPRSVFGHCIHLSEAELQRLHDSRSIIAFCPTSNLFIGSGLFDLARARGADRPVRLSLATDVGGGTSFSMLRTVADAYKILQLQGQSLSAWQAFYMMTLGNARALSLEDKIGGLAEGREADLIVLDPKATPILRHRQERNDGDLHGELFALSTLGDDRAVKATYVAGVKRRGDDTP